MIESNPIQESRIEELNKEVNRLNTAIVEYKKVIEYLINQIKSNERGNTWNSLSMYQMGINSRFNAFISPGML